MKFKLPASPNIKSVCLIACDQLGKKKDMKEKERQGERASEREDMMGRYKEYIWGKYM